MTPSAAAPFHIPASAASLLALLDDPNIDPREPFTFSVNPAGHLWRYRTRGLTPSPERLLLEGTSVLLDAVTEAFLRLRPAGGRFRLDPDTLLVTAAADGQPIAHIVVDLR